MIPNQFLISTALVIVAIAGIVAVYLLVLKRNGWIGRSAVDESPAKKPVEEKPAIKPIIKIQQPVPAAVENKVAPPRPAVNAAVVIPKIEKKEPEVRATVPTAPPLTVKAVPTVPLIVKKEEAKTTKKPNNKKTNNTQKQAPEGCKNYFGYLWSLPKGTATPDECYCCIKLIDCYKEQKQA